jgi:hypothetical protein
MCPIRHVPGDRAGPAALGILVPPGMRTFLILRPRALAFDLVVLRPDEPAFQDFAPEEGQAAARQLVRILVERSQNHIETPTSPGSSGYRLRLTIGPFTLLACPREPGRPYRPLTLPDGAAADAAAAALALLLAPAEDVMQEVYTNTRYFGPVG